MTHAAQNCVVQKLTVLIKENIHINSSTENENYLTKFIPNFLKNQQNINRYLSQKVQSCPMMVNNRSIFTKIMNNTEVPPISNI